MKRRWWKSRVRLRWTVILCALLALTQIIPLFQSYLRRALEPDFANELTRTFPGMTAGLILFLCAGYGSLRAFSNHPSLRGTRLQWLFSTPWTDRDPLPFGSPLPDLFDVPFLVLGVVCFAPLELSPWYTPVCVILLFWSVPMAAGNAVGGPACVYVIALAVPTALRWRMYPMVLLCKAVAMAIVQVHYYRKALRLFSADGPVADRYRRFIDAPQNRRKYLGWPYDVLPTPEAPESIPLGHRTALVFYVSLLMYAIYWNIDAEANFVHDSDVRRTQSALYFALCSAAIVWRLVLYCRRYWPPVSLLGRLLLGRLIIPGYDRVFLAPLFAIVAMLLAPPALELVGLPPRWLYPLATLTVLSVVLLAPPGLDNWRLTGLHRIRKVVVTSKREATRT